MRYLMWFTLGFSLECGFWAYGWPNIFLWLGLGCLSALLVRRRKLLAAVSLLALGTLVGWGWTAGYSQVYLNPALHADGKTLPLTITVTDYPEETTYGIAAAGRVTLEGKSYQVKLTLEDAPALAPGQKAQGNFRLAVTKNPSHPGKGLFLLAYPEGEVEWLEGENSLRTLPAQLRRWIQQRLSQFLPPKSAAMARAVLLGDTSLLDYPTLTDLKLSGIRHVVAVSGLHVSILFALLSALTFHRRFWLAALTLPMLALFAALAGFSPSVNRACLMCGLMVLGQVFCREYDGPTALSFAVLIMLIFNPLVMTSISFQLSVASVAGIFLFQPKIYHYIMEKGEEDRKRAYRLLSLAAGSVSVTLGAMAFTVPLCAWYFGAVSLVGVVTNLLTLWAVTAIFYLTGAVCLVSLVYLPAAALLGKALSLLCGYVLGTAKLLGGLPLAAVYTQSPYIVFWLVFVYILVGVFLLSRKKKPGLLLTCGALSLGLALSLSYLEPYLSTMQLRVLDVGQGQCLLLQTKGRAYLVDCGGESSSRAADLAAETLLSQGITRLDGIIVTHMDEDHAGGISNLLTRIDANFVILPPDGEAENLPVPALYAQEDLQISTHSETITIFPPKYRGRGNDSSLCVLFESENCGILITADRSALGERSLLRSAPIPQVDILIAGHHGSAGSTCQELLDATQPEVVCISAGAGNPYGHPAPELLQRLGEFGCQIRRTDREGTIVIRR